MMHGFLHRFQILIVSVVFFATLVFLISIISRHNHRWDLTPEKLYTLSDSTRNIIEKMSGEELEVIAFYPSDESREEFEVFLRECQTHHPDFQYHFYDPNRRPQLAKFWNIDELYTVILRYKGNHERLQNPNEHAFSEGLMRLLHPREISVCFFTEDSDERLTADYEEGFSLLKGHIDNHSFKSDLVALDTDRIPRKCQILLVVGPQSDWQSDHLKPVRMAIESGTAVLFLIDPMEPGTGEAFINFLAKYNVGIGRDVIVDKMSQMVGGDFLMPLVKRYSVTHDLTANFSKPSFFPVARSIRALDPESKELTVTEIAYSGTNSWSETNLAHLQEGDATFDSESDTPGPISIAAAVEKLTEPQTRMVVIGDSDFLTNAYIGVAGNRDFLMRTLRWLAADDRKMPSNPKQLDFQPLLLDEKEHLLLLSSSLVFYPSFFLLIGVVQNFWRRRAA